MTHTPRSAQGLRARRGFTLIEVLVALILLGVTLSSVAWLSVLVSSRGRRTDLAAQRAAALQQQVSWLGGIPFTRIDSVATGTSSVTAGSFSYTRKIRITSPATNRRTITIVITPTADQTMKDSVMFDRGNPPTNPLCVGC
jgi:prepilin-type N-terminal cleavage/methylation domain-containing protein